MAQAQQQGAPITLTAGIDGSSDPARVSDTLERAVLAAGCFWCLESVLEHTPGVVEAISGYAGGTTQNPTYQQVGRGGTGHLEAVLVVFDTTKITFTQLLQLFWHNVDPFDGGGQFVDRGGSYLGAVFYLNDEQKRLATLSKTTVAERFGQPVVTTIRSLEVFYPAEDYHQNYWRVNPVRYALYTAGNGRERRLKSLWGNERKSY